MRVRAGVVAVLLIGLVPRAIGLVCDLPHVYWHDDINTVEQALRFSSGEWVPHGFKHGTFLPLVLAVVYGGWYVVQRAAGLVASPEGFAMQYVTHPEWFHLIGRLVIASAGLALVGLTYLGGVRLGSRRAGLMAAGCLALAFGPIYMSVQIKEDLLGALCVMAAFVVAWGAWGEPGQDRRRYRAVALCVSGLLAGLATASKVTNLLAVFGVAALCMADDPVESKFAGARRWRRAAAVGALVLLGALCGFLVAEPFALLAPQRWVSDLLSIGGERMGAEGGGWRAWWHHLRVVVGLPLAILSVASAVVLLANGTRRVWIRLWLFPILWAAVMVRFSGYPHYLMPVLPFMVLSGAWLIDRWLPRAKPVRAAAMGSALVAVVMLPSILTTARFLAVLASPDTRTLAKTWIESHVPPGTSVLSEGVVDFAWVDAPPLRPTAEALRRDLEAVERAGGRALLSRLRLRALDDQPQAPRYDLYGVKVLTQSVLHAVDPEYVMTCGYYDTPLFEEQQAIRALPRQALQAFQAERRLVASRLAEAYELVQEVEPYPMFNAFFPQLLPYDVTALRAVGRGPSDRPLRHGPRVRIYHRKVRNAAG